MSDLKEFTNWFTTNFDHAEDGIPDIHILHEVSEDWSSELREQNTKLKAALGEGIEEFTHYPYFTNDGKWCQRCMVITDKCKFIIWEEKHKDVLKE